MIHQALIPYVSQDPIPLSAFVPSTLRVARSQWLGLHTCVYVYTSICVYTVCVRAANAEYQIEDYYNISYTVLSLVFLAPFVGYLIAALSNSLIHHSFGQLGVAVLGPLFRLIGYIPLAFHPPFAALPVLMLFPGFGNGLEDSAWNAWIGNMHKANEMLGVLHGAYGLGATIGPLIATAMVTKAQLPWYIFYYVMIGLAALEGILATTAFWHATAKVYRARHHSSTGGSRTTTRQVLREPIVWLVALFLLGYVGAEVSLGGWIVSFMLHVRQAEAFDAGMTVTGFWLGLTVGRVILGFVTGRIGEKLAISGYLLLSIALQLLYWLVPSFIASAIFVALLGFFLGPLFPAAIVAATKLLPSDYHVSAIGFAAAFGGGGAAIFPFAVGAIAQGHGVQVCRSRLHRTNARMSGDALTISLPSVQPVVLAILLFLLVSWWFLPGGFKPGGLERARDNHEPIGHEMRSLYRWTRRTLSKPLRKPM